jgi:hypothetical protein
MKCTGFLTRECLFWSCGLRQGCVLDSTGNVVPGVTGPPVSRGGRRTSDDATKSPTLTRQNTIDMDPIQEALAAIELRNLKDMIFHFKSMRNLLMLNDLPVYGQLTESL